MFAIIKNQPIKLQTVVFCCKIRSAIWGYPGFRATTQRHHMGISGIRSKQLRAPYGVSRARWVKFSLYLLYTYNQHPHMCIHWKYDQMLPLVARASEQNCKQIWQVDKLRKENSPHFTSNLPSPKLLTIPQQMLLF